ncbi:DUF3892 domain-containing protein [Tepidicaulis sp. LMO-SS28]|uniref:DUF3892 domain-containing protein n=1 Tax=Tepidicaulis sp. LMO-SS28 TaxID=3447455 RepID=UPI003EE1F888
MASYNVTGSSKDEDGDITGLCGKGWSHSKATVIANIDGLNDEYLVHGRTEVITYKVGERKHIRTVPNNKHGDNLDNLPDC